MSMSSDSQHISEIKPTDLRGILKYVPKFQNHLFVIAVDGRVIEDQVFNGILMDIAVLRNLQIRVILVFGIGRQLRNSAKEPEVGHCDLYGTGVVDAKTLSMATEAASKVSHLIMQGLSRLAIKCATTNSIRATRVGVIDGEDQQFRGKVDRVDSGQLKQLLDNHMVPVIGPVAFDREGESLRLDADHLAAEVAIASAASKILFLTSHSGLRAGGRFYRALETEALDRLYRDWKEALDPALERKCRYALRALKNGTARVHILNGLESECLLKEVFSSVGVGTLFYNNEYQKIRWARPADAQALFDLTRRATESEELTQRSLGEIEERIDTYFLYEIDGYILACCCLVGYPGSNTFEVASLAVKSSQAGKGLGTKLVKFAGETAAKRGGKRLVALSTQTFPFFIQKCGFREGSIADLPEERAEILVSSRRNSKVLVKDL